MKNFFIKFFIAHWIGITIGVVLMLFIIKRINIIYVYDSETIKPISNANITIENVHLNHILNCDDGNTTTNINGLADLTISWFCRRKGIKVIKEGYIINGKNIRNPFFNIIPITKDGGYKGKKYHTDPFQTTIYVNLLNQLNIDNLEDFYHFLDHHLGETKSNKISYSNTIQTEYDFKLIPLVNKNVKIEFIEDGGIVLLNKELVTNNTYPYKSMQITKPLNKQYKKEEIISPNKQYLIRLRDGITYIKFTYNYGVIHLMSLPGKTNEITIENQNNELILQNSEQNNQKYNNLQQLPQEIIQPEGDTMNSTERAILELRKRKIEKGEIVE